MPEFDRQIRLLSAYAIFTYPFACIPFLYFFFKAHGISLHEYMWLIAVYYWAMVAMEIPTGVLADRFGRKKSMLTGSLTEMSQRSPDQVRISRKKVSYYKLTLEITDLKTGLIRFFQSYKFLLTWLGLSIWLHTSRSCSDEPAP